MTTMRTSEADEVACAKHVFKLSFGVSSSMFGVSSSMFGVGSMFGSGRGGEYV